MSGNCSSALVGIGLGFAVFGVFEPPSASLPLSLAIDRFDEPDFPWNKTEKPCKLHGSVTIRGVKEGQRYMLLRWDDYKKVPTDGNYIGSEFDRSYSFVGTGPASVFNDPGPFFVF